MLRVDLSGAQSEHLRRGLEDVTSAKPEVEALLTGVLGIAGRVPPALMDAILRLRAGVGAPGTLLVRGVPIDRDLPLTPTGQTAGASAADTHVGCAQGDWLAVAPLSARALLLFAVLLGEPVGYEAEKGGRLIQDVFPVPELASQPANEGSAVQLDFHTELTFSRRAPRRLFHVTSPDFVLLLALRCPLDRRATTVTVEAAAVCDLLDDTSLAMLRGPNFQLRAPHSFTRDGGPRPWSRPTPLLRGDSAAPSLAFDSACGVRTLSPEAEAALGHLRRACDDPAVQTRVQLASGDLLVIDNNRCAHSRQSFPARYDGRDRWLRRVYVRRSIWQLESSSAGARVLV